MYTRKKTKLVYGVGINDANYATHPTVNGKADLCPFYGEWRGIIKRCYSLKYKSTNPAYEGCSVSFEWLRFSAFREWMVEQDWAGKALDKDILSPGNKVYSEDKCCFITQAVNNLLNNCAKRRGNYPQGVYRAKKSNSNSYIASVSLYGQHTYLGSFSTSRSAEVAYKAAKSAYIREVALTQTNARVREALLLKYDAGSTTLSKDGGGVIK